MNAQQRYAQKAIVPLGLRLNRKTDADIIAFLDANDGGNRQGFIKSLIRQEIARKKGEPMYTYELIADNGDGLYLFALRAGKPKIAVDLRHDENKAEILRQVASGEWPPEWWSDASDVVKSGQVVHLYETLHMWVSQRNGGARIVDTAEEYGVELP